MSGGKQNDGSNIPLPQGWEAKYDPAQRRYFFIDHVNKVTSWEDPRIKLLQQQQEKKQQLQQQVQRAAQPQQQQQHLGTGAQARPRSISPSQSPAGSRTQSPRGSPGPQQVAGVVAPSSSIRSTPGQVKPGGTTSQSGGWQQQLDEVYGMKVTMIKDDDDEAESSIDEQAVKRLHEIFTTTSVDLIREVLASCNNETSAKIKLQSMGCKEATPPRSAGTPGRASGSASGTPPQPSHGSSASPTVGKGKGKAAESPAAGKSSQKMTTTVESLRQSQKQPSQDVRKAVQERLKKDYPQFDDSTIALLLEMCSYDETKARQKMTAVMASTAAPAAASDTTTAPNATPSGVVPENSSIDISQPTTHSDPQTITGILDEPGKSKQTDPASKPSARSIVTQSMSMRTKPSPIQVISATGARHGPDCSLAKGPNKQLLLSDYVRETGSKPEHHVGPNTANRRGPDPTLRQGTQYGLALGANLRCCNPFNATINVTDENGLTV